MAPRTFYVETSVWGALGPRQHRGRKQIVLRFLHLLDGIQGQCVISDAVVKEILRAPAAVADHILRQIDLIKPIVFPVTKPLTTWRVPISILASYLSGVNWMQFTWLPQLTLRMIIW